VCCSVFQRVLQCVVEINDFSVLNETLNIDLVKMKQNFSPCEKIHILRIFCDNIIFDNVWRIAFKIHT